MGGGYGLKFVFPQLTEFETFFRVLWMDFITSSDSRLTAIGCKDGLVIVTSVKLIPGIFKWLMKCCLYP